MAKDEQPNIYDQEKPHEYILPPDTGAQILLFPTERVQRSVGLPELDIPADVIDIEGEEGFSWSEYSEKQRKFLIGALVVALGVSAITGPYVTWGDAAKKRLEQISHIFGFGQSSESR